MGKAIVTAARLGAVALCCVAAGCESVRDAVGLEKAPEGPAELRATWAVANTLRSESAVERTVREAEVSLQLNALFVQVRSRGDAWYAGGLEPRPAALAGTDFDPLDEAIDEGGDDVAVHAWINACLVADASDLPRDPRHVVLAHPEWLSVPEPLARDLWNLPPRDPAYVERLARYVTERRTQVEGLFADPAAPEYRAHVVRVVEDLCRRYEIAGVHLDYIRYPGPEWGCSRAALDQFRVEVDRELSLADRRDMAARAAKDPLSYARRYARRFDEFRRRAVSQFVAEIASAARAARPGIWITAATFPDLAAARDQKFQEWPVWLQRGDLDAACPMIYATRAELFTRQLRDAIAVRGRGQIWAGVGAWQLEASETARRVEEARAAGATGVVL
ncbi:MAG TPA: family 10 glycosylhydrolase, partial [Planctomycetota bacterium]|nr:family 10 glycosylhydrolase [Planctomycetota bacterium]